MQITAVINGKTSVLEVAPDEMLADALRRIGFLSIRKGCDTSCCGLCTVWVNGKPLLSCTMPAFRAEGREITTIEGLKQNGEYDYLQKLFVESGAVQCGYCTPGMILSAKALLMKNPHPGEKEIRQALEGNLCRCTGYGKIVEAVKKGGV